MNKPESTQHLCVVCTDDTRSEEAMHLAQQQGLPLYDRYNPAYALQIRYFTDRVELFDTALDTGIHVDFVSGPLAHRRLYGGGRGQPIARAIGLKHGIRPRVLDATAGLARDTFVLATLGCTMTLVERSPVLFALLLDGIRRGLADTAAAGALQNVMNLVNTDAVLYLQHAADQSRPDVIYLDPMYPERNKTALVKKDMQILQHLLDEPDDAAQLLLIALQHARQRVVVKRPARAPSLQGPAPTANISSKRTRFDIYITKVS